MIKSAILRLAVAAMSFFFSPSRLCAAADTITYTYDALGRLTNISHASVPVGAGNDGMSTTVTYDLLGNRSTWNITGSKGLGPRQGTVIIIPLNGRTIIPVGQ